LTGDVSIDSGTTYGNLTIELNGNSISPTSVFYMKGNGSDQEISLTSGNYDISGDNGTMYIYASQGNTSTVTFEDMNFTNSSEAGENGYAVAKQCIQMVGGSDSKAEVVYKNCVFDQTYVNFCGNGDTTTNINAVFENCTFNMTGSHSPVTYFSGMTGGITFKNCTFNLSADSKMYVFNTRGDDYSDFPVNFENVTINASLYNGQNGSVDLFTKPRVLNVNGTIYNGYTEFNTAAKNSQIEGITYNLSQN
jgi:hypothetical protein